VLTLLAVIIIPFLLAFFIYEIYIHEALRVYQYFHESAFKGIFELFKLGYLSLILLFLCFNLVLNLFPKLMGDITGFGDLLFYTDWWNCDGP